MILTALDVQSLIPAMKTGPKLSDTVDPALDAMVRDTEHSPSENAELPSKIAFSSVLETKADLFVETRVKTVASATIDRGQPAELEGTEHPETPLPQGKSVPRSGDNLPIRTAAAIAPVQPIHSEPQSPAEPLPAAATRLAKRGDSGVARSAPLQDGKLAVATDIKAPAVKPTPAPENEGFEFPEQFAATTRPPVALDDVAEGKQVEPVKVVAAAAAPAVGQTLPDQPEAMHQRTDGKARLSRPLIAQRTAIVSTTPAVLNEEAQTKIEPARVVDLVRPQNAGSEQSPSLERATPKLDSSPQQSPLPTSFNNANVSAVAPTATPLPPVQTAASAQIAPALPAETRTATSIENVVTQLTEARETGRNIRPELALKHAEFGAVNMRLENVAGDLRATLSSRDPAFVPAVQAALPERAVGLSADQGTAMSQRGNDGAGSGATNGGSSAGQGGSLHGGASQNSDPRYGSSTGSGQGSSQPYSAHHASEERNNASREQHGTDNGLFA